MGGSVNDTKMDMMACGFNSPYKTFGMTDNLYAEAQMCMLKKGYVADSELDIFCDNPWHQEKLPACKGGSLKM